MAARKKAAPRHAPVGQCARGVGRNECKNPAAEFVMGQHVCATHAAQAGDPNCTHSLAPSGRCSYCGALT